MLRATTGQAPSVRECTREPRSSAVVPRVGMQKMTNEKPEGLSRAAERLLGAGACGVLQLEGGREGDAVEMQMLK